MSVCLLSESLLPQQVTAVATCCSQNIWGNADVLSPTVGPTTRAPTPQFPATSSAYLGANGTNAGSSFKQIGAGDSIIWGVTDWGIKQVEDATSEKQRDNWTIVAYQGLVFGKFKRLTVGESEANSDTITADSDFYDTIGDDSYAN